MSRERVWSRRIADELWSGVVTPLTFTTLAEPMAEHMVRRRLINAGLARLVTEPVFRLSHGRVYVNASLVADVMGEIPAPLLSDGLLELLPERLRASLRQTPRSLLSPSLGVILLNLGLHERGWLPWARAAVFRAAAAKASADVASFAIAPDASGAGIADAFDEIVGRLGAYLDAVSWGMIYAYVFFHLTAQLVSRWAPEEAVPSMPELTMGVDGIRTFEIHDELLACAAALRDDASLRAVVGGDPNAVAERCATGELGPFGARIRELLARHGHRLVGRDLAYPTWRERPAVVVEMVQKLLDAGVRQTSGARHARHLDYLRRVSEKVSAGLGGTARRLVFERTFAWCEEYYVLRENMRYHADLFLSALRGLALSAAAQLVAEGALAAPEDVFYLEASELRAALRGGASAGLAGRAAARRIAYAELVDTEPAESVADDGEAIAAPTSGGELRSPSHSSDSAGRGELCGLGVSPGRAIGAARIVHSMADLKDLRAGEVIVAAATDPSWTSLLAVGGALVLEMGGLLSHGAIVARELGIPAVVNVAQATRVLVTGDRVVVDGKAGTVARA